MQPVSELASQSLELHAVLQVVVDKTAKQGWKFWSCFHSQGLAFVTMFSGRVAER